MEKMRKISTFLFLPDAPTPGLPRHTCIICPSTTTTSTCRTHFHHDQAWRCEARSHRRYARLFDFLRKCEVCVRSFKIIWNIQRLHYESWNVSDWRDFRRTKWEFILELSSKFRNKLSSLFFISIIMLAHCRHRKTVRTTGLQVGRDEDDSSGRCAAGSSLLRSSCQTVLHKSCGAYFIR